MKCDKCGHKISQKTAKFCPNCGAKIEAEDNSQPAAVNGGSNRNMLIIAVTAIIVVAIIAFTAIYITADHHPGAVESSADINEVGDDVKEVKSDSKASQSSEASESKTWQSIGSFSGSGSGSRTIEVPAGQIRIDLSAYPIKNYATNHLYVSGSNGQSAGVDWGPKSAVATRSDSLSFTSSSPVSFTISYYETVSWNVQVYAYK